MDQTAVARRRLEAVGVRAYPLCEAATPRRRPGPDGANRRQPTWPLAAQQQPRAHHRDANRLLPLPRFAFRRSTESRILHRTAVYGPVRTVVWEGRSREAPPYPDERHAGAIAPWMKGNHTGRLGRLFSFGEARRHGGGRHG